MQPGKVLSRLFRTKLIIIKKLNNVTQSDSEVKGNGEEIGRKRANMLAVHLR